ncbi:hypothetical protein DL95DRAFT_393182 [Leptodontidium sp. 2 PMI_412]|nr:hypothetical protein DL95DRAFT_393182 [Leptodontidium sp. 2 PMI_412]
MPPSKSKKGKKTVFVFFCCSCGHGPIPIRTENCPCCQQPRCSDCRTEKTVK